MTTKNLVTWPDSFLTDDEVPIRKKMFQSALL